MVVWGGKERERREEGEVKTFSLGARPIRTGRRPHWWFDVPRLPESILCFFLARTATWVTDSLSIYTRSFTVVVLVLLILYYADVCDSSLIILLFLRVGP